MITNNVFSLNQQPTDPPSSGSGMDGRAALEILESGGVTVTEIHDIELLAEIMDPAGFVDIAPPGGWTPVPVG